LADRIGKVLDKIWVVRDPTSISTLEDIWWETTPRDVANYVVGTGGSRWREENTTFHDSPSSALADAKARLKKLKSKP
jgi:hypothetical protein